MRRASGEERMRPVAWHLRPLRCGRLLDWLLRNGRRRLTGCGRFLDRRWHLAYGSAGFADDRDDRIDFDRGALRRTDLSEYSGHGRGNLGVHFVGGDLKERVVFFDRVTGLLEPLGDRALKDRLAHLGHDDFRRHAFLFRDAGCADRLTSHSKDRGIPGLKIDTWGTPFGLGTSGSRLGSAR